MSWNSSLKSLIGISTEASRLSNLNVSVEIYQTVIERIRHVVSESDREEGGKFIGKINQTGNQLKITVETYIDSGPRVSNSTGHLMPDGEYQEAMFRVLEKFDPNIHYLGSWHTHHCNGLSELSQGDVSGYQETLNSRAYNLDYFFALLVTALRAWQTENRYYLFFRGQDKYYELDNSAIHIVSEKSPLELLLKSAEETALAHRRSQSYSSASYSGVRNRVDAAPTRDVNLEKIRSEDQEWILRKFPSAKARRAKKDGSIYWEWQLGSHAGCLDVIYQHPSIDPLKPARLEIFWRGKAIISEEILLNDLRFDRIQAYLKQAVHQVDSR